MLQFDQFIPTFSSLSVLKDSKTAKYIYKNVIGRPDVRVRMAMASEFQIPALAVCAKEIETICVQAQSDLDLNNRTVKQGIGRMVKESLRDLGYEPVTNNNHLSDSLQLEFFSTATTYKRNKDIQPAVTLEIVLSGEEQYREVL